MEKFQRRALDYIQAEVDDLVLRQIEYADAAKFTVAALIMSEQSHLLWESDENLTKSSMETFVDSTELGIDAFWAALHGHFSTGELKSASPALITPFIRHLYEKGDLKGFVKYIKYLDVASLDINLLLKLFWSMNHFRGIISVYNRTRFINCFIFGFS